MAYSSAQSRPIRIVAQGDVWFRAMSMAFDTALLEFMRAMRLGRRKPQLSKTEKR
jgi:hypothetical protein